jgi:hypothetical protein
MPCGESINVWQAGHIPAESFGFLGCPGQAEGCLQVIYCNARVQLLSDSTLNDIRPGRHIGASDIGVYGVQQSVPMEGKHIGILDSGHRMSVLLAARAEGAGKYMLPTKIDAPLQLPKVRSYSYRQRQ